MFDFTEPSAHQGRVEPFRAAPKTDFKLLACSIAGNPQLIELEGKKKRRRR